MPQNQPVEHDSGALPALGLVQEVLDGLQRPRKTLPSKLFYDEAGSALFDRITELDEYYPTRTEIGIMERHLDEMAAAIGEGARLVEFGSGSSEKTRLLLERAQALAAYVPVDISCDYLDSVAAGLRTAHPTVPIFPVCADYTRYVELPVLAGSRTVVYFPGSTIGNFEPGQALDFLRRTRRLAGEGGGLLIGIDLKKDPATLHAAYNDAEGVTAAFNMNMLVHINRTMGGTFDPARFRHYALYNPQEGRIEMYLVSADAHTLEVGGAPITFREGEAILTEYSYKFTLPEFTTLAASAGFHLRQAWSDPRRYFAVLYLDAA